MIPQVKLVKNSEDVVLLNQADIVHIKLDEDCYIDNDLAKSLLTINMSEGEFKNTAFKLNPSYTWTLGADSNGSLLLIPTRK